eukprot:4620651-Heterocapsa_arctica.AAC.1
MPIENKDKSMMTEEMMKHIADFVSMNQKTELLNIDERLASIEHKIAAGKEMTEIGLRDIDKNIDTEHYYRNKEKFMQIMESMNKMGKMKKGKMEEERAKTEESEEEEE